jgi:hypothetical protein
MAGVQPPLDHSPATNGTLKVNSIASKGKERKRGSSFSLSYFEEDEEDSIEKVVEKEEPPKPPPAIVEKKDSPQISSPPTESSQPAGSVEQEESEDPAEEEEEKEEAPARGREDLMCLFTPDSFPHVKELALEGKLNNTNLRGVTWRVCSIPLSFLSHLLNIV